MSIIANHSDLLRLDLQEFSEDLAPADPVDTTPVDTPDPVDTEPSDPAAIQETIPQAFKVKYNKEEMEIPYDQAPDYIQKGLNYDKVQQRSTEYEQHLTKLANLSGYTSTDEMIQALQELEQQQQVQQQAQQMGIDEETYSKYFSPVNDELSQLKSQLQEFETKEIQRQIDADLNELRQQEDFSQHEQSMYEIATQYGMPLKEAYEFASLRALKSQLPTIQQQSEQKVLDQIKARQGKHVETSDNNVAIGLDLTPQEIEIASKMGISPEEYAKYK
ncbi:MAG: hypothetical protein ABF649_00740 [Bacillus sp. (in: firmicutes)]